ncbi:MAG: SDR family oxidoreductase [Acidobacteria bacterium]|nr:SDR family oxidoreductase [Acidobacteriota bacterium]
MGYLDGKAVVVTGAGRGIGRAYALLAAAEGAAVIVNDIDADVALAVTAELSDSGARASCAVADVGDWSAAASLVEQCIDEFGAIDGLVNNAGLFAMASAWELDPAEAEQLVRVNVVGTMACGSAALRAMVRQGSGSIVNIVSGAHFGIPNMSVYAATKGAAASLIYAWSMEAAGTGVRVNGVSPLARTRMSEAAGEFYRRSGAEFTSGAGPDPAVNAPAVVFLLSDAAAGLNGQIVRIERDQLAVVAHPAVREPVLRGDWTVAGIEHAFQDTLNDYLVPVGMSPLLRAEYVDGASDLWNGR